jgi:hypothetical protein
MAASILLSSSSNLAASSAVIPSSPKNGAWLCDTPLNVFNCGTCRASPYIGTSWYSSNSWPGVPLVVVADRGLKTEPVLALLMPRETVDAMVAAVGFRRGIAEGAVAATPLYGAEGRGS